MTVSKFYRVSGSTTQKQGLTPDIILPSLYDYLDIGEASLENSLPADQTTPASYTSLDQVKRYLGDLQTSSKERISRSQDFAYLLEDIEQVKKRKDDKSISLNEAFRQAEKDQEKARRDARKKERSSRPPSTATIYELNVEMAEAGKPLEIFNPLKAKEEDAELARASIEGEVDGDEAEADPEADPLVDPHLEETLQIARDYSALLNKDAKPAVVLKETTSAVRQ